MTTPRSTSTHTARALAACLDAAERERDMAEWLVTLIATTSVLSGRALTEGRPGSWEAALVDGVLQSSGRWVAPEAYERPDPRAELLLPPDGEDDGVDTWELDPFELRLDATSTHPIFTLDGRAFDVRVARRLHAALGYALDRHERGSS